MPQKVKVTTEDGQSVVLTLDDEAPSTPQQPVIQSTDMSPGMKMATAGKMMPIAADAAENFATSPTAWKTARGLGELAGGAAGLKAGPLGMAAGIYGGGKAGYRLSNALQRVAAPVASGLQKIAPYAQMASTLGGAQGVNDLAQMAEPNRKDIGFLGVGPSVNVPGAHPPVVNALWQALMDRLSPQK
jgi:hypothetical protein